MNTTTNPCPNLAWTILSTEDSDIKPNSGLHDSQNATVHLVERGMHSNDIWVLNFVCKVIVWACRGEHWGVPASKTPRDWDTSCINRNKNWLMSIHYYHKISPAKHSYTTISSLEITALILHQAVRNHWEQDGSLKLTSNDIIRPNGMRITWNVQKIFPHEIYQGLKSTLQPIEKPWTLPGRHLQWYQLSHFVAAAVSS